MTYIGMPSDSFDNIVIKMTRVAKQASDYIISVFQPTQDVCGEGYLRALVLLGAQVKVLDPVVMSSRRGL